MAKRTPVSAQQNIFSDSQLVDDSDLNLEQDYNTAIQSSIINNHIGIGVLPEVLVQNILFDSSLVAGLLDGKVITAQNQPADNNYGNQLEITLSDSNVSGKRTVKVGIIGLDFNSALQYETFTFKTNETLVSKKHFTQISLLLFNDFIGQTDVSFNLGGKILIKEAKPMTLSRDPVMVSQDIEPNLFFRDFYLDGFASLTSLLQTALPLFNIDDLNIFTAPVDNKLLLANDVTTQIGQKFQATTNNIQKVSLLLSARNTNVGEENDLAWTGDLIVSIYPLQSNIECPSDIAPNLQLEFPPSNIPLAQFSFNYASLLEAGTVLDSVPQPVDFVFSNTPLASGNIIVPDNYYAVSVKRSGSADKCDILLAVGSNRIENSRITTFTGTLWVDIPEEDLWFKIYTDAAKVSDGQGYESGHGIIIPKTIEDADTLTTIDHSVDGLQFTGNNVFKATVLAITEQTDPIPDQRTGDPVLSRKQFVPQVQLLNSIDINNLTATTDPLIIGAIADKNKKFFDSLTATINSKIYSATMVNDELVLRIVDDPSDAVRFDTTVTSLASNLLNGDFINAKITPDIRDAATYYRIASASLCSMLVGDVNGDGIIDDDDLELLNTYIGYNLNVGLFEDSVVTTDGYTTTFSNGYTCLTQAFVNLFGITFQVVNSSGVVIASGTDGVLIADPNDERLGRFASAAVNFGAITTLTDYKLVIISPSTVEDYGGFDIVSLESATDIITIRKIFLTGDVIKQMMRADIDGDFYVTTNDGYLLESYIDRINLTTIPAIPHPGPTSNPYQKIGTRFNVITFRVEKYVDRADDYSSVISGRATTVHPVQDIFFTDGYIDGYYTGHNFYSSPTSFSIQKKLTWEEYLIAVNSRPKLVPNVFSSLTGFIENSCDLEGIVCNTYPIKPDFDSGKVDCFVPNNLIIGDGGELHRSDGTFYKVDFEVGTITLEMPVEAFDKEHTINLFDTFVVDYTGEGITRSGFNCMKFADCSSVLSDAISKNQVRFSVSVQSFSPEIDGFSYDGYSGPIVDGRIGVSLDYSTGVLTLNFTNLHQDPVLLTASTKIQINVFLKKAGFNNSAHFINSTQMKNLLGIT